MWAPLIASLVTGVSSLARRPSRIAPLFAPDQRRSDRARRAAARSQAVRARPFDFGARRSKGFSRCRVVAESARDTTFHQSAREKEPVPVKSVGAPPERDRPRLNHVHTERGQAKFTTSVSAAAGFSLKKRSRISCKGFGSARQWRSSQARYTRISSILGVQSEGAVQSGGRLSKTAHKLVTHRELPKSK